MTYEEFKSTRDNLMRLTSIASKRLSELGAGSGRSGLTPAAIKKSPEYQMAKRAYDVAFGAWRKFNLENVQRFKKEIWADHNAKSVKKAAPPPAIRKATSQKARSPKAKISVGTFIQTPEFNLVAKRLASMGFQVRVTPQAASRWSVEVARGPLHHVRLPVLRASEIPETMIAAAQYVVEGERESKNRRRKALRREARGRRVNPASVLRSRGDVTDYDRSKVGALIKRLQGKNILVSIAGPYSNGYNITVSRDGHKAEWAGTPGVGLIHGINAAARVLYEKMRETNYRKRKPGRRKKSWIR